MYDPNKDPRYDPKIDSPGDYFKFWFYIGVFLLFCYVLVKIQDAYNYVAKSIANFFEPILKFLGF